MPPRLGTRKSLIRFRLLRIAPAALVRAGRARSPIVGARAHSGRSVSRADRSCAGSAHGPTRISISPGSSTGSRSTPRNSSSFAGNCQPRRTGLAGPERELRHALQLERGARHARDAIAHEQEHGFLGRTSAFVRDVDGHFDRIVGRNALPGVTVRFV